MLYPNVHFQVIQLSVSILTKRTSTDPSSNMRLTHYKPCTTLLELTKASGINRSSRRRLKDGEDLSLVGPQSFTQSSDLMSKA